MTDNLLSTKLTIPPIRQKIVTRQKLIDRLNAGLTLPLALVSSPPGFGKTTALSAWAQQANVPVGWLTLEQDDNDITRFIQYFYAAAQTVESDLPDLQVELVKSPHQDISSLLPMINNLNSIITRFALVLDDYQEISVPSIHNAVTY
ncbi:MAG: LuxR family transcriptional regulator, partial [Anaerolineales bacterium]